MHWKETEKGSFSTTLCSEDPCMYWHNPNVCTSSFSTKRVSSRKELTPQLKGTLNWVQHSVYSSIIIEVWKDVAQLQIHVRNLTDWQTCGQMHAMYYHIVEEAHIWKGDHGEHVCSGGVHMWKGIAQCTCTVYRVQTRACGKPAHSRRVTLVYSTNDARMNILRTMGWVVYSEVARMWKVVAHLWTSLWKKSLAFKSHAKLQYNKLLKHWLQFHCCPSAENCCRPTNLRLSPALC